MLASEPLLKDLDFRCKAHLSTFIILKAFIFLVEFYEIEHLQSIDDAVDDLVVCCQNNGGTLR